MRLTATVSRPFAVLLLASVVFGVTGCKWFKKGNPDYAMPAEARPLEVPPDLTAPSTAGAMQLPPVASSASAGAPAAVAASATGFNVSGNRDEIFTKVGEILGATEGVTIASGAQLLGTYDVSYDGSNFLVRVVGVEGGAYVSAVDPRGLPASGEAATRLMATLKDKLGS
ncbi:hypothetical protein CSC70_09950 [Pseudoxanthomonas kalamensis DSM 18571]|uniref:hypothetical protein n=1 Tax=Pseudoxanthomonas kalamensis TaxID=289483 RepID=UPI00139140E6|nr:hypothetical protein [Pseudoxanthomonas kalamensis]KAF1709988.1 hypothetical protein CSC70_09950 [Pseudoxanthomonas kalamensis DSM 18571]